MFTALGLISDVMTLPTFLLASETKDELKSKGTLPPILLSLTIVCRSMRAK